MRVAMMVLPLAAFGLTLAVASGADAQPRRGHGHTAPAPATGAPAPGGGAGAAGGDTSASGDNTQVQATVRNEGGRRVYVATGTIEVRGEIQRPYAFSLSGRSSLGYSYLDVPVHFVQEILSAVRHSPF